MCMKVDLRNAFNEVDRDSFMDAVHSHFPELYGFVNKRYGTDSKLWTKDWSSGKCRYIWSTVGVQQGDPLSPFLFSIALHFCVLLPVNRALQLTGPGAALAYLDDMFIMGEPAAVVAGFDVVVSEGPKHGLHVNFNKCAVYASRELELQALEDMLPRGLPVITGGMEILGGMIGDYDHISQFLARKVRNIEEEASALLALPDSQQLMLLIRLCLGPKFNHLMRHTDPEIHLPDGRSFATAVDQLLRGTFIQFLRWDRGSQLKDIHWSQCNFPLRQGGLGILDAHQVHHAAFVASSLECAPMCDRLHGIASAPDPVGVASPARGLLERARTLYNVVERSLPATAPGSPRLPTIAELQENQNKMQCSLSRVIQKLSCQAFHDSSETPTEVSDRVKSCGEEGGAVFSAVPKSAELTIDDILFLNIVLMHLGLPLTFIEQVQNCVCRRAAIDRTGFHLLSVCTNGNQRTQRHHVVRDILAVLIRHAGYLCTKESSAALRRVDDRTNRRTDVSITTWKDVTSLEIDVSITDARTLHLANKSEPGKAAGIAEKHKNDSYKTAVEAAGGEFMPFVMEAHGRWGESARKLFKLLVREAASSTGADKAMLTSYWRQRFVVGMRRAAMQGLRERAQNIFRSRIEDIHEEQDAEGLGDIDYIRTALGR
jgi:hypothetical protein